MVFIPSMAPLPSTEYRNETRPFLRRGSRSVTIVCIVAPFAVVTRAAFGGSTLKPFACQPLTRNAAVLAPAFRCGRSVNHDRAALAGRLTRMALPDPLMRTSLEVVLKSNAVWLAFAVALRPSSAPSVMTVTRVLIRTMGRMAGLPRMRRV